MRNLVQELQHVKPLTKQHFGAVGNPESSIESYMSRFIDSETNKVQNTYMAKPTNTQRLGIVDQLKQIAMYRKVQEN